MEGALAVRRRAVRFGKSVTVRRGKNMGFRVQGFRGEGETLQPAQP